MIREKKENSFNGKIGNISRIKGEQIFEKFPGEKESIEVEKDTEQHPLSFIMKKKMKWKKRK